MNDRPRRDWIDVVSLLGTLLSPILLLLLTGVVNHSSEQVKASVDAFQNSVAKAQLVHTLIDDFVISGRRQDLALIGLNRSIGDLADPDNKNRLMVAQIAGTIFEAGIRDHTKSFDATTNVAFAVISERCGPKAPPAEGSVCRDTYDSALRLAVSRASAAQRTVISDATVKPGQPPKQRAGSAAAAAAAAAPTQYLASAFTGVVYIQYADPRDKNLADGLRTRLNADTSAKLTAPGIELVRAKYPSSVRYFHDSDRDGATRVAGIVKDYVKQGTRTFRAVSFGNRNDVPVGQLEVWIGPAS